MGARRPDALAAALLLAACGAAPAQTAIVAQSVSVIADAAPSCCAGNIALNASAGIGNAQANLAAVGIADGLATAGIASTQQAVLSSNRQRGFELAEIAGQAFRSASGIVAVNQSSGRANIQANLAAVAAGRMAEVSLDQLGRVNAAPDLADDTPRDALHQRVQAAFIADAAFAAAHGIVQVNQVAGAGNSTANIFAFSISMGAQ